MTARAWPRSGGCCGPSGPMSSCWRRAARATMRWRGCCGDGHPACSGALLSAGALFRDHRGGWAAGAVLRLPARPPLHRPRPRAHAGGSPALRPPRAARRTPGRTGHGRRIGPRRRCADPPGRRTRPAAAPARPLVARPANKRADLPDWRPHGPGGAAARTAIPPGLTACRCPARSSPSAWPRWWARGRCRSAPTVAAASPWRILWWMRRRVPL